MLRNPIALRFSGGGGGEGGHDPSPLDLRMVWNISHPQLGQAKTNMDRFCEHFVPQCHLIILR